MAIRITAVGKLKQKSPALQGFCFNYTFNAKLKLFKNTVNIGYLPSFACIGNSYIITAYKFFKLHINLYNGYIIVAFDN